jgi:hypothetical protein
MGQWRLHMGETCHDKKKEIHTNYTQYGASITKVWRYPEAINKEPLL